MTNMNSRKLHVVADPGGVPMEPLSDGLRGLSTVYTTFSHNFINFFIQLGFFVLE